MECPESNDERLSRLPPLAICICGRPMHLKFSQRFGMYFPARQCECGAVLEISSDELAAEIVAALREYYGIADDGPCPDDMPPLR